LVAKLAPVDNSLTLPVFEQILSAGFLNALGKAQRVAIGVSGGPDSMALCKLLSMRGGLEIHALTVDHGLRPEAAAEAAQVGQWLKGWPGVKHSVLKWEGAKPESKIQEKARDARYQLFSDYCAQHKIRHLFLAHHQDDQAETFLFRLAKGSGLDGLSGMMPAQNYSDDLVLLRPLLDVAKEDILVACAAMEIPFVNDPSNEKEMFARVRLRKAKEILEQEGLSAKRLSVTAKRFARARQALDEVSDMALQDIVVDKQSKRIVLNYKVMRAWPGEVGLRVFLKAMAMLRPDDDYGPRMEKAEALFEELMLSLSFKQKTLGGLMIERNDKDETIVLRPENKA
jgi:tRNA(Ile)-lysidine synthase